MTKFYSEGSLKTLSRLNPYFLKYRLHLLGGVIFVIISNIFGVFSPILVRNALDMIEGKVDLYRKLRGMDIEQFLVSEITRILLVYAGLVLLASLIRGVFLFLTRQTLIVMSRLIEQDMRNDMYTKYQELSLSFFRKSQTGDLMARISEDIPRVRMYLGPGVMYTINTFSRVLVVVSTMLMVNPYLTFFALLPLPFLGFGIYYIESFVQKKSDLIQRQLSRLTSFTQEAFSGIRILKAYHRESDFSEQFEVENKEFMEKSLSLALLQALFFPMIMLLVGASTIMAILIGGEKVIKGDLTLGNVAEFIIYINLLTWPIISLGWVSTLIQRASASQSRINYLMDQNSEIEFTESEDSVFKEAEIEFINVSFTYPDTAGIIIFCLNSLLPTLKKLH